MQIYYFTRSGTSKKIAEELAQSYNTQALEITDGKSWNGGFMYFKAAVSSAFGQSCKAKFKKPDEADEIAVVFPIWAGTFPPAVKTFVNQIGRARLIAVPTSLGSTLKPKSREGFIKIIDLVGDDIKAPKEL